jgi:drug/metabolite transporter (DMT)-like permease
MQTKVLGTILIVVGLIMIAYTGFNYITTEKVVDLGPIQVDVKKNNFVKLSPVIGIVLLIGGVFFLLRSKKTLN